MDKVVPGNTSKNNYKIPTACGFIKICCQNKNFARTTWRELCSRCDPHDRSAKQTIRNVADAEI